MTTLIESENILDTPYKETREIQCPSADLLVEVSKRRRAKDHIYKLCEQLRVRKFDWSDNTVVARATTGLWIFDASGVGDRSFRERQRLAG